MKMYTFPYGTGEWDGTIEVGLTNKEAALLDASMVKHLYFHMDEDPTLNDIDTKIRRKIFNETKKMMREDGRLRELKELDPESRVDDLVDEELGNFHVCLPNAFEGFGFK